MEIKNRRKQYFFYQGNKICLRGIEREDYTDKMYKWANDPDFNRYLSHGLRPTTVQMMERLYEALISKENFIFAVVDRRNKLTIGIVALHHLNWQARHAEFTIHIGEKKYWGSGSASEAAGFVLSFAFNTLNLNKVWLGVNSANKRAIAFYRKRGFMVEGRLREEIFQKGEYSDSMRMSILKKEYKKA